MENITTWNGQDPLTLRVQGTGEYVKSQLCNIVQHFEDAEYDHEQDIRNDMENDYE